MTPRRRPALYGAVSQTSGEFELMARQKQQVKSRWEMTINELIRDSGWFDGTEREWMMLSSGMRKDLAFKSTGCQEAYATWQAPCQCSHPWCRVRRDEIKPISVLNGTMRYERESGWWRFIEDRKQIATMYRHFRKLARQQNEYDLWKLGGTSVALIGIIV